MVDLFPARDIGSVLHLEEGEGAKSRAHFKLANNIGLGDCPFLTLKCVGSNCYKPWSSPTYTSQ